MLDLDHLSQQHSQAIVAGAGANAENTENLVTKVLGVVQENGIYASMLFLLTRSRQEDKLVADSVRRSLLSIAAKLSGQAAPADRASNAEILKYLTDKICQDLDLLLLVKQVWEQTLVYARFGAKAQKS